MAYTYGMNLTPAERAAKNVADLIELNKGTVPYDRDRGVEQRWKHKNRSTHTAALLTDITDMVNARIDEGITVKVSQKNGEIVASVEVAE